MPGSINIGQEEGADYLTGSPLNQLAARYEQRVADLMTIMDFCDAMAARTPFARMMHALAHRVTDDSERWVDLELVEALAGIGDEESDLYGPAWPDVRRRMLDLLERVQSGATVWERGR